MEDNRKYRVHEVAKDFGIPSQSITEILGIYSVKPRNHMQPLRESDLAIIFEYLTQRYQVPNTHEDVVTEDNNEFGEMLNKQSFRTLNTGEKVTGIVRAITTKEVEVDVGARQTAYIKFSELTDDPNANPGDIVHVGDEIEAYVVRVNDVEGFAELSKRRLDAQKKWEKVEEAVENKTVHEGVVTEENKGGIVVLVDGIRVFVPASQSGKPRGADLSAMKGQTVRLRITEFNHARHSVVGSIRAVLEEEKRREREALKQEIEKAIEDETIYEGLVTEETKSGGLIVSIREGFKAFVPKSQSGNPRGEEGRKIRLILTGIDPDKGGVYASIRAAQEKEEREAAQRRMASLLPNRTAAICEQENASDEEWTIPSLRGIRSTDWLSVHNLPVRSFRNLFEEQESLYVYCETKRVRVYCHSFYLDKLGDLTKFVLYSALEGMSRQDIEDLTGMGEQTMEEELTFLRTGKLLENSDELTLTALGQGYAKLLVMFGRYEKGLEAQLNLFTDEIKPRSKLFSREELSSNSIRLERKLNWVLMKNYNYANSLEYAKQFLEQEDTSFLPEILDSLYTVITWDDGSLFERFALKPGSCDENQTGDRFVTFYIPCIEARHAVLLRGLDSYRDALDDVSRLYGRVKELLSSKGQLLAERFREEQEAEEAIFLFDMYHGCWLAERVETLDSLPERAFAFEGGRGNINDEISLQSPWAEYARLSEKTRKSVYLPQKISFDRFSPTETEESE